MRSWIRSESSWRSRLHSVTNDVRNLIQHIHYNWKHQREAPHKGTLMISLIADNLDAIANLCRDYRIHKLDLFGSASSSAFDPETSDVDLIADLGEYEPGVSDRFFRFVDALEMLFGRKVDLLTESMIKNPYFRQAVEEQRVNLYEARDREAAA